MEPEPSSNKKEKQAVKGDHEAARTWKLCGRRISTRRLKRTAIVLFVIGVVIIMAGIVGGLVYYFTRDEQGIKYVPEFRVPEDFDRT